jgi:hypothetical protein
MFFQSNQLKVVPNSKSEHLSWEEAMEYLQDVKWHILSIKGYWSHYPDQPKVILDIDHIWCLKKSKEKAWDFLFESLGLVDFFEIEH